MDTTKKLPEFQNNVNVAIEYILAGKTFDEMTKLGFTYGVIRTAEFKVREMNRNK